jgi:hypothetical protein
LAFAEVELPAVGDGLPKLGAPVLTDVSGAASAGFTGAVSIQAASAQATAMEKMIRLFNKIPMVRPLLSGKNTVNTSLVYDFGEATLHCQF